MLARGVGEVCRCNSHMHYSQKSNDDVFAPALTAASGETAASAAASALIGIQAAERCPPSPWLLLHSSDFMRKCELNKGATRTASKSLPPFFICILI